jgi:hypothetical protein
MVFVVLADVRKSCKRENVLPDLQRQAQKGVSCGDGIGVAVDVFDLLITHARHLAWMAMVRLASAILIGSELLGLVVAVESDLWLEVSTYQ